MLKISSPRYMPLYPVIGLLGACTQVLSMYSICNSSIYCSSGLLHTIQLSRIFPDSKTFVDLKLRTSESKILTRFTVLMNQTRNTPSRADLQSFLDVFFEYKMELSYWHPPDFHPNPPFVDKIKDLRLKQFAKDIINIWPKLGRKVTPDVAKNPNRYSFIPVPKGFMVPGGRFKELYYWDSYWIIRGLLICNMKDTAKGMIENFFLLVLKYGYIPNGSRIYYLGRSQPPLLPWMVSDYYAATGDVQWLKKKLIIVELEMEYWMENKHMVVEINDNKYKLLRYISDPRVRGPRPESYYEDYMNGHAVPPEKRQNFHMQIKSAAESGWDFSSRWFVTSGKNPRFNLTDTKTTQILPVDLNSIFAGSLQKMGDLFMELDDKTKAKKYWTLAKEWRSAIENVMWDPEDGVWYDYDVEENSRRRHFYLSCAAPLWAGAVQPWQAHDRAKYFVKYLKNTGAMNFPGGVPTSLRHTGEQWDYPNAWPPLQAILIGALEHSQYPEAHRLAKDLIETWVNANYIGYNKYQQMYEKYSCSFPGEHGSGGEYEVQSGFGWTNGYILELLERYGSVLKLKKDL